MKFFESVEEVPPDSIFGLNQAFVNDLRPDKVNLVLGVYKDEALHSPVLPSVKEAERVLLEAEMSKSYLPIDGDPQFREAIRELVLGEMGRGAYVAQTPGGTGALRVGGVLLHKLGHKKLYVSDPTWANHHNIFQHAGFSVEHYPYYSREACGLDFDALCATFRKMERGSVVLLHGCCHNPTGFDPTLEQWEEIFEIVKGCGLLPFFDIAYQGFGEGIEVDARAVRMAVEKGLEVMIAYSCSKNFGLYAERTGALLVVCGDEQSARCVGSQVKVWIRGMYSNPPCHGARIVSTVWHTPALKRQWEDELEEMRTRIASIRKELCGALQGQFKQIAQQKGMFSYTGLNAAQAERLREEHGIYMTKTGRINIAGLNKGNFEKVTSALAEIVS